jgi:hypothetical protein
MPDLPDSSKWQPERAGLTLDSAFEKRCAAAEELILLRADAERRMAIHTFDSGLPTEEIVREQLRELLPRRYAIRTGTVVDSEGFTAGDCDLLVFNDIWFPIIKAGPTVDSRHLLLPVEGLYAVGEIKQTLSAGTLDKACEKLVKCHRLQRPRTYAHRMTENREECDCTHGLKNPLYSFVLALNLDSSITFEDLVNRFFDICRGLKRLEVIRCLCVLGHGTVVWGFDDPDCGERRPALFMEADLFHPIYPVYSRAASGNGALYPLVSNLLLHLFHTVLAAEDIAARYGPRVANVKIPTDRQNISLQPDPEWCERLTKPCRSHETT